MDAQLSFKFAFEVFREFYEISKILEDYISSLWKLHQNKVRAINSILILKKTVIKNL